MNRHGRTFTLTWLTRWTVMLAVAAVITAAGSPAIVVAQTTRNWIDDSGPWSDPARWDPTGVPAAGDDVNIAMTDGVSREILYDYAGPAITLNSLNINLNGGADPAATTLVIPANTLRSAWMTVGTTGRGTLTIENGGVASVQNAIFIASDFGSIATTTVSGADSKIEALGWMNVGNRGPGWLFVDNGGLATTPGIYLGGDTNGDGQVNVSGIGSRLQSGYIDIGAQSLGALIVENGGVASSSGGVVLGEAATAAGEAEIGDAGSSLQAAWGIAVGNLGTGRLAVTDGGSVSAQNGFEIGYGPSGVGAVTVTGADSTLEAVWSVIVGNSGEGTLMVQDEALVSTPGSVVIGHAAGSQGTATVTRAGEIAALTPIIIGNDTGAVGEARVSGADSSLHAGWYLTVGRAGQGTLTVNDGGSALADNAIAIGGDATGVGQVVVTGAGSTLSADWYIAIGYAGKGELSVNDGAIASAENGIGLGNDFGSVGEATISGADSRLVAAWGIAVGISGEGTLTVRDGGAATAQNSFDIGYAASGVGTVTVTGTNSTLQAVWGMAVGNSGEGTLTVDDHALVSTLGGIAIGHAPDSQGTVTVRNSGVVSALQNVGIGNEGHGRLVITAGGTLNTPFAAIGGQATGAGAVQVQTAGMLETDGPLLIGGRGTGTLEVANGGQVVTGTFGRLAESPLSDGTVTVTGAGSKWTVASSLEIGLDGQGTMRVQQGGEVSVGGFAFLGGAAAGHGLLTVTGAGSKLTSLAQMVVGLEADSELVVSDGALLDSRKAASATASSALIGRTAGVTGFATITGPGTQWIQDGGLNVGFRGIGAMNVQNGATVHSVDGVIARFNTATGTASVSGGANWRVDNDLHVGGSVDGSGGTGTLDLLAGGEVRVGNMLRVWTAGTVDLSGGTLAANTIQHTDGGTFNFTGGTLHVNTFTGNLENDGGTLAPGASPGTTTITGGYEQNAGSLQIELASPTSFDKLIVSGDVSLGGALDVSLLGAYSPAAGATFDILHWGNRGGVFDAVNLPPLAPGLHWSLDYFAEALTLIVSQSPSPLPGDINLDGRVNDLDAALFTSHLGTMSGATWTTGDFNDDDATTLVDLAILQAHFGQAVPPSPAASANAVPEPSTLMLALAAIAGLGVMARRWRSGSNNYVGIRQFLSKNSFAGRTESRLYCKPCKGPCSLNC
jgi:T5SS/PEP-CTERM-associated repeat protein